MDTHPVIQVECPPPGTYSLLTELETRLELATYGLQDRCATDCATPAETDVP